MSFPRYGKGFFADLIERYLRGELAVQAGLVSPWLAALPFALDRWQAVADLRRWLAEGCLVVCNRYVAANMAHQGSKLASEAERRAFFEWIGRLEYGIFELPRPDLQILMDVPAEIAQKMTDKRNAETEQPGRRKKLAGKVSSAGRVRQTSLPSFHGYDIHEADKAYLESTAEAYRQMAREAPGAWAVINCAPNESLLSPTKISDAVWAEARRIL
jgi:dTMP kinase